MDSQIVAKRLHQLVDGVLDSPEHSDNFVKLFSKLNLDRQAVTKRFINYTLKVDELVNDDYQEMEMMAVLHINNLFTESYHQTRQSAVSNFMDNINPGRIVDVGFGVPSKYFFERLNNEKVTAFDLFDRSNNALVFAETLLNQLKTNWQTNVSLKLFDMNDRLYIGDYDTYIFMDAIEHTQDPTEFLKLQIAQSKSTAKFIFSIPICKIDTLKHAHYIEWLSESDAEAWLNSCGLKVIDKVIAKPNPDVDFFAEKIDGGYYNTIYLTEKICQEKIYQQYDELLLAYDHSEVEYAKKWPEDLEMFKNLASEFKNMKVLDVGCGIGNYVKDYYNQGVDICGIDSSSKSIENGQKKNIIVSDRLIHASFESIPFSDNSFDAVVSRFALHYAVDPIIGLKEMHRVLKSGGEAYLFLAHPTFLFANKKAANYSQQEIVELRILNNLVVREPSHTFADYINPETLKLFDLVDFYEAKLGGIEATINGAKKMVPTFFYIKLRKK